MSTKLRQEFSLSGASTGTVSSGRIVNIRVPTPLYNRYVWMYRRAALTIDRLEAVLNDGDHALMLAEGRAFLYDIPDEAPFQQLVDDFRRHQKQYNPFMGKALPGDMIEIDGNAACRFIELVDISCQIVTTLFRAVKETEYMAWLGEQKKRGIPYNGPSSLQEMMDLWVELYRIRMANEKMIRTAHLPEQWQGMVKSPVPVPQDPVQPVLM